MPSLCNIRHCSVSIRERLHLIQISSILHNIAGCNVGADHLTSLLISNCCLCNSRVVCSKLRCCGQTSSLKVDDERLTHSSIDLLHQLRQQIIYNLARLNIAKGLKKRLMCIPPHMQQAIVQAISNGSSNKLCRRTNIGKGHRQVDILCPGRRDNGFATLTCNVALQSLQLIAYINSYLICTKMQVVYSLLISANKTSNLSAHNWRASCSCPLKSVHLCTNRDNERCDLIYIRRGRFKNSKCLINTTQLMCIFCRRLSHTTKHISQVIRNSLTALQSGNVLTQTLNLRSIDCCSILSTRGKCRNIIADNLVNRLSEQLRHRACSNHHIRVT